MGNLLMGIPVYFFHIGIYHESRNPLSETEDEHYSQTQSRINVPSPELMSFILKMLCYMLKV